MTERDYKFQFFACGHQRLTGSGICLLHIPE